MVPALGECAVPMQTKDADKVRSDGTGQPRALLRLGLGARLWIGGAGAILLAAGAGGWWAMRVDARARTEARVGELRTGGLLLSEAARGLITADDPGPLRSLASGAVADLALTRCRLVLPDGTVIYDAMSAENRVSLPEGAWSGTVRSDSGVGAEGVAELRLPVRVPDRGELALELAGRAGGTASGLEAARGLTVVSLSAGLVGLLAAYRMGGGSVRALEAFRGALGAASRGATGEGELAVAERFGPEASVWNRLMGEREQMRRMLLAREATAGGATDGRAGELAGACDALAQGLLLVDARGRVAYANGAAATLLGLKREEMGGKELGACVGEGRIVSAVEDALAGKSRQRATIEWSRGSEPNESSVLRCTVRLLRREEGGQAMVMIEDVTQQRVADEARNSFVAQVTHELRSPLTNIRLYVESMLEDAENAELRGKAMNVISTEVRRLERVVADMLSVSEIEAGTLRIQRGDVRLDALFEELKEDYRAAAEDKELRYLFELPPKLPVIQGDRDKLGLALHNLLSNAIKYTPAGGTVTLRVEEAPDRLLVHVVDNGIGVRNEEQGLIFEKFYRAKDKRVAQITGTGLGLTLARDIARLHGGDIEVSSEPDRGSEFTLWLPLAAPVAVKSAA